MIQSYTIKGRVVQFGNNKPLDKVKVSYSTFITYTNKRGIYKLPIKIEVNDKGEVAEKFRSTELIVDKGDFSPFKIIPIKGNNKLKTKINVAKLHLIKNKQKKILLKLAP